MNVSNKFKYVFFADETNILYSSEEFKTVENIINKTISSNLRLAMNMLF